MGEGRSALIRSVRGVIRRFGMDVRRPLVLVSGGADSVALLRLLLETGSSPTVLHVDHGLRGAESDADAEFVAALCKTLGVPCVTERLDLSGAKGLQEAARRERYRLAGEHRLARGLTSVATGHNADDVAETLLMNAARGAGTSGAASIPPVSPDGSIVRPLITAPRTGILAYLDLVGQAYRMDSSNLEGKYARNRVRLTVLPVLEELYPGASRNLARTAELLRKDLRVLEELASRAVESGAGETRVVVADLPRPGLLGHALRVAYKRIAPGEPPPGSAVIRLLESLVGRPDGTRTLDLPGDIVATVRFGEKVVLRRRESRGEPEEVPLTDTGDAAFEGWTIRVDGPRRLDPADAARPEVCYLDRAGGPYRVRRVREGDSIRPLGLGGTKKVFRAMMDRKVPGDVRSRTPVVVGASGEVAWVFLGETGEKFAVREKTEAVIRLEISGGRAF